MCVILHFQEVFVLKKVCVCFSLRTSYVKSNSEHIEANVSKKFRSRKKYCIVIRTQMLAWHDIRLQRVIITRSQLNRRSCHTTGIVIISMWQMFASESGDPNGVQLAGW